MVLSSRKKNAKEAGVVDGVKVAGVSSLKEVVANLNGTKRIEPIVVDRENLFKSQMKYNVDFTDVKTIFSPSTHSQSL